MVEVGSLVIADSAQLWSALGFVLDDEVTWVSGIRHEFGSPGRGVVAWTLRGGGNLTELPLGDTPAPPVEPTPRHPNGVVALDHLVIATPDLHRTIAAFEQTGIELRRTREAGTPERPTIQAFFRLGPVIAEVVGSPDVRPGPARFYGVAYTVADLDDTARFFGDRLRPAKDAVQAGRRIATLDRAAASSVEIAFMSER